jgi:hypothetical protein
MAGEVHGLVASFGLSGTANFVREPTDARRWQRLETRATTACRTTPCNARFPAVSVVAECRKGYTSGLKKTHDSSHAHWPGTGCPALVAMARQD